MKNFKCLQTLLPLLLSLFCFNLSAQQLEIEYDSSTDPAIGPQLLVSEKDNTPNAAPRIWLKTKGDPGDNRWAILARPSNDLFDNDGLLAQPFVIGFNGVQILGLSKHGELRINRSYILPNSAGTTGQALIAEDLAGNTTWGYQDRVEKNSDFSNSSFTLHETEDEFARLAFENSANPDFKFIIAADPVDSGAGNPAELKITYGDSSDPSTAENFLSVNATTDIITLEQNTEVEGILNITEFYKLSPRTVAPACTAGGTENGIVYFHGAPNFKLRVCVNGVWESLN